MAKKATKQAEGTELTIEFVNGETLSIDLKELSDDIRTKLALHGLSQKGGDSYAGAESIEDAVESAKRVFADLREGRWTAQRMGGGGGPRVTQLAEALSRVATATQGLPDMTVEEAVELIAEMDDDQKKALRGNTDIKRAIAEIKLEKAKAETGGESLADLLA